MTLAIAKLLPEPVIPSRVWNRSPRCTPSTSAAIASGWSPAGARSVTSSNSGTTRSYRPRASQPFEVGPDRVELFLERVEIATVVDPPGRDLPALLVVRLQRDPALGILPVDAALDEPRQPHVDGRVHDDDARVVAGPLRLDQQRDVVDDDRVLRGLGHPPEELRTNRGVGDRLQLLARLLADERLGRERGPVERAVGMEDVGPESLDELGERGAAGLDDLPGDDVRVDDDGAPPGERKGDGRLAGTDATGQADHQHADGVYERAHRAHRLLEPHSLGERYREYASPRRG